MIRTRVTDLFRISAPIVQGGMVWVSGNLLAAAVSAAGGLGLLGAGSMKPAMLREEIGAVGRLTERPFGVNIPLLRGDAAELVQAAVDEGVRIVFTSAGHPAKFIEPLKKAGCIVTHVISTVKQARKAEEAGCDAVVAEGFEAGGHNGPDEITTMCLVPQVADAVRIPVIAAGGIADARGLLAALCLGAEGAQIGTRFAATAESAGHPVFKEHIVKADDCGTILTMRKMTPVRLIKTPFALRARDADLRGAAREELAELLGEGRERAGMSEGDLEEGEFEAGQCSGLISDLPGVAKLMSALISGIEQVLQRLNDAAGAGG
jgi:enoyl-[acyl-carrier protein] reductase II